MLRLDLGGAAVRPWRSSDADDIVPHANDRRVWRDLRDAFPHPYGRADALRFIERASAEDPPTAFAIEVEGRAAGGIGFTLHEDVERVSAEIGYWLGARYWGRGITTRAVAALSRHAFGAHPVLTRLYAVPFAWNPASARVLEKAGYRREATLRRSALKDGEVVDQWLYALLREELDGS